MSLKFVHDLMSQPSRALYIFLKLEDIPFEPHTIDLLKGEHMTDDFRTNYTRFQKVPAIHDDDFRLNESIAIIRYLAGKHDLDSKWYPKDLKRRALIDEYLEWQHSNIRVGCGSHVLKTWVRPFLTGKEPGYEDVKRAEKPVIEVLDQFEKLWLKDRRFIAGDKISIADIFAASEIEATRLGGYDPCYHRPILGAWLDRVKNITNPYYDEAFAKMNDRICKDKEEKAKKAKL